MTRFSLLRYARTSTKIRHGNMLDCNSLIIVAPPLCYGAERKKKKKRKKSPTILCACLGSFELFDHEIVSVVSWNDHRDWTDIFSEKNQKQPPVGCIVGGNLYIYIFVATLFLYHNSCPKRNKRAKKKKKEKKTNCTRSLSYGTTVRATWHRLAPSLYIMRCLFQFSQLLFLTVRMKNHIVGCACKECKYLSREHAKEEKKHYF